MQNDKEYIGRMKKRYAEMYGRMILESEAYDVELPSHDVTNFTESEKGGDTPEDDPKGSIKS